MVLPPLLSRRALGRLRMRVLQAQGLLPKLHGQGHLALLLELIDLVRHNPSPAPAPDVEGVVDGGRPRLLFGRIMAQVGTCVSPPRRWRVLASARPILLDDHPPRWFAAPTRKRGRALSLLQSHHHLPPHAAETGAVPAAREGVPSFRRNAGTVGLACAAGGSRRIAAALPQVPSGAGGGSRQQRPPSVPARCKTRQAVWYHPKWTVS
ncbi:hypothetical protein F5X68DRAFT_36855 [Plectosphaerella plurivora]|uniref:Uncharacterized protein n=1 Tax=Plectosphaerella plurivora TaxID=936078 RepID=A0A9P8V6G8_9PEZI|nr:hypothetical protein F5X68DRAFT_36855 [Plectosphaerella plurivora]